MGMGMVAVAERAVKNGGCVGEWRGNWSPEDDTPGASMREIRNLALAGRLLLDAGRHPLFDISFRRGLRPQQPRDYDCCGVLSAAAA